MLPHILHRTDPMTKKDPAPSINSAKAKKWALDHWLPSQTEVVLDHGPVLYWLCDLKQLFNCFGTKLPIL